MPFLKEKNLIFIHIPKNAGKFIEDRYGMSDYPNSEANQGNRSIISNIARAVLKLDEDSQHFAKTHGRRMFDIGLVGQHLTLIEMQLYGLVPRNLFELKVLASVRSPYTRAISLYCNVVNQNIWNQNDFEEFCKNWTRDFNSNYRHIKFCQKRLYYAEKRKHSREDYERCDKHTHINGHNFFDFDVLHIDGEE